MPLRSDPCLCLRKFEYSETSQILTLFSREHGLIRAIAKGAHRRTKQGASKFDGGLDLLDFGQAVFTHDPSRDLATLIEWSLRDGHLGLRKSLRATYLATYAAELTSLLIEEHDPHPRLFDSFLQTLDRLQSPRLMEQSFLAFELMLLQEIGLLPELSACVSCGVSLLKSPASAFMPKLAGALCGTCAPLHADRLPIDPRLLRLLQTFLRLPPERLPSLTRHQTDPLNRLLLAHVQYTLNRPIRSARYILGEAVPVANS